MRVRLALWWVSLAIAVAGLLWFLLNDVFVRGPRSLAGWEVVKLGALEVGEYLDEAWQAFKDTRGTPDVGVWMVAAIGFGLPALLLLRGRPSSRSKAAMVAISIGVAFAAVLAVLGVLANFKLTVEPPFFGWLAAVALLCATPFLRRRDQIEALRAWARRPHALKSNLPARLDNLPPALAHLTHETRRVRVSLDPLNALDNDTRRLLWDWSNLVEDCAPDDAALLQELGITKAPVEKIMETGEGAMAVVDLDATLAHIERTLVDYRSYGFR